MLFGLLNKSLSLTRNDIVEFPLNIYTREYRLHSLMFLDIYILFIRFDSIPFLFGVLVFINAIRFYIKKRSKPIKSPSSNPYNLWILSFLILILIFFDCNYSFYFIHKKNYNFSLRTVQTTK